MAAPVLLVHDDIAVIATARRLLSRAGHEVVLATSTADALTAFSHRGPSLVILSPAIEGGKGQELLQELRSLPEGASAKVLLLGQGLADFEGEVTPLPLRPEQFVGQVAALISSDALAQPSDDSTLLEVQEFLANRRQSRKEPAPKPPAPVPAGPSDWDEDTAWEATLQASKPAPKPPKDDLALPPEWSDSPPASAPPRFAPPGLARKAKQQTEAKTSSGAQISAERIRQLEQARQAEQTRAEEEARRALEAAKAEAATRRAEEEASQREQLLAAKKEAEAAARIAAKEAERKRLEAQAAKRKMAEEAAQRELQAVENEQEARRELESLREQFQTLQSSLEQRDLAYSTKEDEAQRELEALRARVQELQSQLEQRDLASSQREEETQRELELLRQYAHELKGRLEQQLSAAEQEQMAYQQERLAAEHREMELEALRRHAQELEGRLESLQEQRSASEQHGQASSEREEEVRRMLEALRQHAQELQNRLDKQAEAVERERQTHRQQLSAAARALQGAEERGRKVDALRSQLEAQQQENQQLKAAMEEEQVLRVRAEEAEKALAAALEEARRAAIHSPHQAPLAPPETDTGRRVEKGPFRHSGEADSQALAEIFRELAENKADARIELVAEGSRRVLWLKRGAVVGARSSLAEESLLDQARRDGLFGTSEAEALYPLRGAAPSEVVQSLLLKGLLREEEVTPLLQRYHERIALEALGEVRTSYRVAFNELDADVLAEVPRPTLHLVFEALKRAATPELLLQQLGGLSARVEQLDVTLDAARLGLEGKEAALLSLTGSERTLEELFVKTGVKAEQGLRFLAALGTLNMVHFSTPDTASPAQQGNRPLDLERLDAKYKELADADYFRLLGVSRHAGSEEVGRAFHVLRTAFDPLKYVGSEDPSAQHRAQQVVEALAEAAQALKDDRLRTEYARNLVD